MKTTDERVFHTFILTSLNKKEKEKTRSGRPQERPKLWLLNCMFHDPPLTPNSMTLQRTKMYKSIWSWFGRPAKQEKRTQNILT